MTDEFGEHRSPLSGVSCRQLSASPSARYGSRRLYRNCRFYFKSQVRFLGNVDRDYAYRASNGRRNR